MDNFFDEILTIMTNSKKEFQKNGITISGGKPKQNVSWQVTGVRHDPLANTNALIVEKKKRSDEKMNISIQSYIINQKKDVSNGLRGYT